MNLVLGATGGIGHWTTVRLAERGAPVRVLVRDPEKFRRSWPEAKGIDVVRGDALVGSDVRAAARGATTIFHCVNVPYPDWSTQALPMLSNTLDAARAARAKIVFPGNVYVFGHAQKELVAEDHPKGAHTRKGRIRVEMERRLEAAWRQEGIPYTIVRFPDFYGPDVVNELYRPVFANALRGRAMPWYGKLEIPFEFSFIEDAAQALVLAGLDPSTSGETYHLPGFEITTPRAWLTKIAQTAGTKARIQAVPRGLIMLYGLFNSQAREFLEMQYLRRERLILDGSKFRAKFGRLVASSYDEGIRATLDWYRSRGAGT